MPEERLHKIYVAESQLEVIKKLRELGCLVSFHPEKVKNFHRHGALAYVQPYAAVISDCTRCKVLGHAMFWATPPAANSLIELYAGQPQFPALKQLILANLTVEAELRPAPKAVGTNPYDRYAS